MAARLVRGEPDSSAQHPRVLPPVWAALVAALMFLGDLALDRADAFSVPARWHGPAATTGIVVLLLGSALSAWAAWQFARVETPIEPGRTPTTLVTSGPFRWSRNPIYLGMALGLVGWALWLVQPAALVGPPAFVAVVSWRFVRSEERTLEQRFGHEYHAWRSRVRRWL